MKRSFWLLFVAGAMLFPEIAQAAGAGGTGMPWDGPLSSIFTNVTSFVGPTLIALCIIGAGIYAAVGGHGMAGKFAAMVFGGALVIGFATFMAAVGWAGALV